MQNLQNVDIVSREIQHKNIPSKERKNSDFYTKADYMTIKTDFILELLKKTQRCLFYTIGLKKRVVKVLWK